MKYSILCAIFISGVSLGGCASSTGSITQPVSDPVAILTDEYRDGTHVYEGVLNFLSPCTDVKVSVSEGSESSIVAKFVGKPFEGICEDSRTGVPVRFSARGDSDAQLSVLYNGKPVVTTTDRIPAHIILSGPLKNAEVGDLIDIKGRALSDWFVGNDIRVRVTDTKGTVLTSGFAHTDGVVSDGYTSFSGTVSVPETDIENGYVVIEKPTRSNEESDMFRIPIVFDSGMVSEGESFLMSLNEEKTFGNIRFRLAQIGKDTRDSETGTGTFSVRIEKIEPSSETIWLTVPDSDTEPISDVYNIVLRDVVSDSDTGKSIVELVIISR